ncbi:MAG: hypothetical protein NXI24_05630 [bacterium]|nr:hypothetical protein [bacterium]
MKIKTLSITLMCVLGTMLFAGSLQAQTTLRLNVGYWPGDLDPELEDRYFKDDLFFGTGIGRLNDTWSNKHTNTIYPLGVEFLIPAGPGRVTFAGNYIRYEPEYEYTGIGLFYLSDVKLGAYKTTDWEAEAGYEYPVIPKKLLLTPKVGFREHFKEFTYEELSIGTSPLIAFADNSFFSANARGMYLGLEAQFYVTPEISLIGDFMFTPGLPGWDGSMTQERNVYGIPSGFGSASVSIERGEAGYKIDIFRYMLGVQYDVTSDLSVQVGLRQEQLTQSYPDYFAIPILLSTVSAPSVASNAIVELLTDKIFYDEKATQTKGLFFIALSYDVDL